MFFNNKKSKSKRETLSRGGKTFKKQSYIFNGKTVYVIVEVAPHPGMIINEVVDISNDFNSLSAQVLGMDEEEEFFSEVGVLFNLMEGNEYSLNSLREANLKMCYDHIQQYGRLIDSDLASYVGKAMHVVYSIVSGFKLPNLTSSSFQNIQNTLERDIIQHFEDHIYVHYRGPGVANPLTQPRLVKLTDMK